MKKVILEVYTDGACRGNNQNDTTKRKSSAGFIIKDKKHYVAKCAKFIPGGSNSQAELEAVNMALKFLIDEELHYHFIHIYTDSQFVYNTFTKWIDDWIQRGWKKKNGSRVMHERIVKSIKKQIDMIPHIDFHWIRGHSGNLLNEEVDKLCESIFQ